MLNYVRHFFLTRVASVALTLFCISDKSDLLSDKKQKTKQKKAIKVSDTLARLVFDCHLLLLLYYLTAIKMLKKIDRLGNFSMNVLK